MWYARFGENSISLEDQRKLESRKAWEQKLRRVVQEGRKETVILQRRYQKEKNTEKFLRIKEDCLDRKLAADRRNFLGKQRQHMLELSKQKRSLPAKPLSRYVKFSDNHTGGVFGTYGSGEGYLSARGAPEPPGSARVGAAARLNAASQMRNHPTTLDDVKKMEALLDAGYDVQKLREIMQPATIDSKGVGTPRSPRSPTRQYNQSIRDVHYMSKSHVGEKSMSFVDRMLHELKKVDPKALLATEGSRTSLGGRDEVTEKMLMKLLEAVQNKEKKITSKANEGDKITNLLDSLAGGTMTNPQSTSSNPFGAQATNVAPTSTMGAIASHIGSQMPTGSEAAPPSVVMSSQSAPSQNSCAIADDMFGARMATPRMIAAAQSTSSSLPANGSVLQNQAPQIMAPQEDQPHQNPTNIAAKQLTGCVPQSLSTPIIEPTTNSKTLIPQLPSLSTVTKQNIADNIMIPSDSNIAAVSNSARSTKRGTLIQAEALMSAMSPRSQQQQQAYRQNSAYGQYMSNLEAQQCRDRLMMDRILGSAA